MGWWFGESNTITVFAFGCFFPSPVIVVFLFIFKAYNKIEKKRNTKGSDKIRRRKAYGGGGRQGLGWTKATHRLKWMRVGERTFHLSWRRSLMAQVLWSGQKLVCSGVRWESQRRIIFSVGPRSIIIHLEVPPSHYYLSSGFIMLGFCLYQFFFFQMINENFKKRNPVSKFLCPHIWTE